MRTIKLTFVLCAAVLFASVIADSSNGNAIIRRINEALEEIEDLTTKASRKIFDKEMRNAGELNSLYYAAKENIGKIVRFNKLYVEGIISAPVAGNLDRSNCQRYFDKYVAQGNELFAKQEPSRFLHVLVPEQYGLLLHLVAEYTREIKDTKGPALLSRLHVEKFYVENVRDNFETISLLIFQFISAVEKKTNVMDYSKSMAQVEEFYKNGGRDVIRKTYECVHNLV